MTHESLVASTSHRYGIHALVWTGEWTPETADDAIRRTAAAGYDLIELALLDPYAIDVEATRRSLDRHGLSMVASLGLSPATDISSEDEEIRRRGEDLLHRAAAVVRDLGGDYLCGVIYGSMSKHPGPASRRSYANSVESIQRLADTGAASDIRLGLEVVNRYESNLLNTARQAMDFLSVVDRENVYVHLDTYHMNIEEPDMASPIAVCGDRLGYVHVGESHRGYLGSGSIDFRSFFAALANSGYAGPITFESFSSTVVDPVLSNTLAIWRDLWRDSDDLARHARTFMQTQIEGASAVRFQ
ncbi:sugar phosphate isomerase/epimerase family protein [Georgenia thermotolerans]|uniref:TIM barrel protein n=1 Tax=Georgenia thermotolerans TaxID=527326 RepID=A0A7J5UTQ8_9MICO|nr:sugar phosphate isomerase/epimerase family protein [Georgenia thermotolerans]KAE8765663.1 TIM barrel protein [Georgenia thermotolerans]